MVSVQLPVGGQVGASQPLAPVGEWGMRGPKCGGLGGRPQLGALCRRGLISPVCVGGSRDRGVHWPDAVPLASGTPAAAPIAPPWEGFRDANPGSGSAGRGRAAWAAQLGKGPPVRVRIFGASASCVTLACQAGIPCSLICC